MSCAATLLLNREAANLRRFSTSLRALAIFGVLLHAGLIVWHNAAMLGATMQYNAVVSALANTCHGSGASTTDVRDSLPDIPTPGNEQTGCPICKGCVAAIAILPDPALPEHCVHRAAMRMEIVGEIIAQRLTPVRPPTRAPPIFA